MYFTEEIFFRLGKVYETTHKLVYRVVLLKITHKISVQRSLVSWGFAKLLRLLCGQVTSAQYLG